MNRVTSPRSVNDYVVRLKSDSRNLDSENSILSKENSRLKNELEYALKRMNTLKQMVKELQDEIAEKNKIIDNKNRVIININEDIEKFSTEIDLLIKAFGLDEERALNSLPYIFKNRTIGINRDLMFGLNIDEGFLQSSSMDVIKHYLHTINATKYNTIPLKNIIIKNRRDFVMIAKALIEYIKLSSKDISLIEGIVEIHPEDILNEVTIEYFATSNLDGYISSFIAEYNLEGEISYEEKRLEKERS